MAKNAHTQMEVDSVHCVIDLKIQYATIAKEIRTVLSPYEVIPPDFTTF